MHSRILNVFARSQNERSKVVGVQVEKKLVESDFSTLVSVPDPFLATLELFQSLL